MIAARMVLRVLRHCGARGYDERDLARSMGLSLEALSEPEARIPYEVAIQMGERALSLTRDENFGLRLASDVSDPRNYDTGLLLLMASPSVRVAIESFVENQRYWGDGDRVELLPAHGGICLRFVLRFQGQKYARHADECALAEIVLGIRALTGAALHPRVVRFHHRAPSCTALHQDIFRCPIEFLSEATEVVFDDAVLDTPMPHGNVTFYSILEHQVESSLARIPRLQSATDHARAAARATLGTGACTLETTARQLGLSARTLQRRLREEGTSFAELLDALRREMAAMYLEHGLSIADVAQRLDYSDATAFHHAFARWTGSSPKKLRSGSR
jgi:AraC-like DNA-binding protein